MIGLRGREAQNFGHREAVFRLSGVGIPALKISMGSGEFKDQDRSLVGALPLGHRTYVGRRYEAGKSRGCGFCCQIGVVMSPLCTGLPE